jgi:hypothetical protein
LANNIYWTDSEKLTVEVYSLNTKERTIVQQFYGSEKPIALALAPMTGLVLTHF